MASRIRTCSRRTAGKMSDPVVYSCFSHTLLQSSSNVGMEKRIFYPAGESLGHVDDLPVGVHDFQTAALTGVF